MTSGPPHPRTVLVIDDDVVMRDVLTLMLTAEGYTVQTAESGDAAIDLLSNSPSSFDVILTDMHMPGRRGLDLAESLRALTPPGTLLVGMSGSEPQSEEIQAFSTFLAKPFSAEAFTAALEAAQTPGAAPAPQPAHPAVLNKDVYSKLAAMMPAAQLRELYRVTLDDVRRRIDLMREAAARGDLAACRAEAHSIKGGCGMVGAAELSALAAAAEKGADAVTPTFADFDAACARLQSMLEARIA